MSYSNSSLATYTKLSPNNSGLRAHTIDRISPHCVVGQCSIQSLGSWFALSSTRASSNYGIDKDGKIGLFVEEKNRSWCTSSSANDNRAITIECASDSTDPYAMHNCVYTSLIKLCVDICKRNGKTKLLWIPDKNKALNYSPKSDEMLITVHRWFANKSCPGDWLYSRLGSLADQVNRMLGSKTETTKPSTSTATTPGTTKSHSTLRLNSPEYEEVKTLQTYLNKFGANLVVDGLFGIKTYLAVREFQKNYDLFVDGIVGPNTWGKLDSLVKNASAKKTLSELAKEVISGKWGNWPDREKRLTEAGYNYKEVQDEVDKLMGKK